MDRNEAEQVAWKILGEVEEMMGEDGVAVFSSEGCDGVKAKAFFEDREYIALENTIVRILMEATGVQPVMCAQPVDGHDW